MSSVLSVHLCVYVPKKIQYINSISIHLSIISVYIKPTQKTVVNLFKLPFWNYSAIMLQHIQCLTLAHKTIGLIHSEFLYTLSFYPKSGTRYKLFATTYRAIGLLRYVFFQILQALLPPSSFVNIQNLCVFLIYLLYVLLHNSYLLKKFRMIISCFDCLHLNLIQITCTRKGNRKRANTICYFYKVTDNP